MNRSYKGERFFLYDPEGDGMQYFATEYERDQAARAAINNSLEDGVWSELADQIVVGVITASAKAVNIRHKPADAIIDENGDDEDGVYWGDQERICDYELAAWHGINALLLMYEKIDPEGKLPRVDMTIDTS